MGLTSCPDTGMVVINRRAILDVCLGGSEKYSDALDPAMEQSVRVRGAVNAEGVLQFHDFKFDFSAKALNTMETEQPESYVCPVPGYAKAFVCPTRICYASAGCATVQNRKSQRTSVHNSLKFDSCKRKRRSQRCFHSVEKTKLPSEYWEGVG